MKEAMRKELQRLDDEFYPKKDMYLKVYAELFTLLSEAQPRRPNICTQEEVLDLLKREGITSAVEVARAFDWLIKEGYLIGGQGQKYTVHVEQNP